MARLSRLVIPGIPHHVTQRGNRNQPVFFGDDDYIAYRDLLAEWAAKAGTQVWAWCLMPNHVHLILTPSHEDGLRAALGETHRRYTRMVNTREGWRGHLWQERFHSFPMDEAHLRHCARYVALNPVAAGLAKRAKDWRWSSARAHLTGKDDGLTARAALDERIENWPAFLKGRIDGDVADELESHMRTGRPLGGPDWIATLEASTGRSLTPAKRGRPKAVNKAKGKATAGRKAKK